MNDTAHRNQNILCFSFVMLCVICIFYKKYKKIEQELPRPGFSLFECHRQKNGLLFSKYNGLPDGPKS